MKMFKGIICIVGPTATGKTQLSVNLAERLNTEIISADSVQIYKELDIGSAKPSYEEMRGITHHMIDLIDINSPSFSVSAYKELAFPIATKLINEGKTPIIAGGSGLYVNAFISPLGFAVPSDAAIRSICESEYEKSPDSFIDALMSVDSISAGKLHKNDKKRLVRAMEVYRLTGKPLSAYGSDFQNKHGGEPPFNSIRIGLNCDRELLYQRINKRVDTMIEAGLIEEAKAVYNKHYSRSLSAMQSIGYRQLFDCFDGLCSEEEAIDAIKRETRRFAKRQITWFKRDTGTYWLDCMNNSPEQLTELALGIINKESEK